MTRLDHIKSFALLSVLVGLSYFNALQNGFIGDDFKLIVRNHGIMKVEALPALFWSDYWVNFRGPYEEAPAQSSGLYRPLALFTYAVNYAMGGLNPMGYHSINVLIHLLITWLAFLVFLQIGIGTGPALAGAAIFAVHPLHTEAVTQVIGRAELLMSLGVLGAVLAHLQKRPALAMVSFAVGLFSKEQAMVLPFLLLAYDFFAHRATHDARRMSHVARRTFWKIYLGYFVLLLAYLGLRAKVLGGIPLPPLSPVENPLAFLDWGPRVLTTVKVAGWYLGLFIWPATLVADYSESTIAIVRSVWDPGFLWGLASWAALLGIGAWAWIKRDSRVWLAVALTVLTFFPVSNLVVPIGTIMAERLFYLPSAGLCFLVALACDRFAGAARFRLRLRFRQWDSLNLNLNLSLLVLIPVCLALMVRTIERNQDWKDTETLFRHAVAVAPNNAKAHIFLSGALQKKEQWAEALAVSDEAARLHPAYLQNDAHFLWQRGKILIKLGRNLEAVEALEQAATLDPKWGAMRVDLGLAYAAAGNYERAEAAMRRAITLAPESPNGYSSLSLVLVEQGRYAEGLDAADAALHKDPTSHWARLIRAEALEGLGRLREAAAAYEHVLALAPGPSDRRAFQEAQERLPRLLARLGR